MSATRSKSALTFLRAFRAGASAREMDLMLADVRRDYQMQDDAAKLAQLAHDVADGITIAPDTADEVAALLSRARYLMEAA